MTIARDLAPVGRVVAGMDDEVLDVRGAARLLGVGRNTLYEAVARGQVPHLRVGRLLRFSRRALLATMGSWSEPSRGQE